MWTYRKRVGEILAERVLNLISMLMLMGLVGGVILRFKDGLPRRADLPNAVAGLRDPAGGLGAWCRPWSRTLSQTTLGRSIPRHGSSGRRFKSQTNPAPR